MSYTEIQLETGELEEVWRERALSLLKEEPDKVQGLILQLRELGEKENPNLKLPTENGFYLKFLRGGLMDPETSMEIIRNYYKLKMNNPQYFKSCSSIEELAKSTYPSQIQAMLPFRDGHGRRIYVFRPGKWNPDKIPFNDIFCASYMLCEMIAREERTQIAGITAIVDAQGFGFKQMRAIGLENGKNMASFFNIAFPVWLRQSHVLNAPRVFHMLFNMMHPFLNDTVKEEVVFHSGDITSTLKEYFRLDLLPKDLGGTGSIVDNSNNVEQLRSMKEYMSNLGNFGYEK
ncbi:alpha-tocopherol transfer protein [Eurytemora carolleeae]|uniref:alpha-tocopherol transfer protein n=1 Tax=Eurytemora carolleeae TaxID=1294199 RepID=UPI000C7737AE|nr:alpha-tocopherol transfer protein [Eurytemora carolleeae]|eukprot:XP_023347327.1 alpha-tocopherol transfer protein-like [Eurytemora affinis]